GHQLEAAGRFRVVHRHQDTAIPPRRQLQLRRRASAYFQIDLSASQRWPLSSLASASTEPLSSFWSSSSSPEESSDNDSFGPADSSDVVMTGLPIHSISLSDAPGLSADTRPVTSIVSVSSRAGRSWFGRLKVSFSFPVVAFQADDTAFAESLRASTAETADASLSLLSFSLSRQSVAAKRTARSISTTPVVQPAALTPVCDLAFAISAAARSGSTAMVMVCSPARSASQETARLPSATSTSWPFNPFRNSSAASSFTRTPTDSGETSVKSLGAGAMPSSVV